MMSQPHEARGEERKGENYELKAQLNSQYGYKRKEAVKNVIASMTLGNDVSVLFADVIKNMQTEDLELKKLVYLYLATHARSKPTLVVLAVNSFIRDTNDRDPRIRALAVRTMGMLRIKKIIPYLIDPIKKSLNDTHPYVRKTAVICAAKIVVFDPSGSYSSSLVKCVKKMLDDRYPMVIANAVTALLEISEIEKFNDALEVTNDNLKGLLKALRGCTEWSQVSVLKGLMKYKPSNEASAINLCNNILGRLQHNSPSVGLSSVKLILSLMQYIKDPNFNDLLLSRISKFLVAESNSQPEVSYVILKNICIILQICPEIKINSINSFFVEYKDPLYLKLEKLNVLIAIVTEENVGTIFAEVVEYVKEIEPEFAQKAVKAIGSCALIVPSYAERCNQVLVEMITSGQDNLEQVALVVLKDIYRKYGDRFSKFVPIIFNHIGVLDRSDAQIAAIWFIGEYSDIIENYAEILKNLVELAAEIEPMVHIQLLTIMAKLDSSNKKPVKKLLMQLLDWTTKYCKTPDVRCHAYTISRILSETSKKDILSVFKNFKDDTKKIPKCVLNSLIGKLGSIESLYWEKIGYEPITEPSVPKLNREWEENEITDKLAKAVEVSGIEGILNLNIDQIPPIANNDNLLRDETHIQHQDLIALHEDEQVSVEQMKLLFSPENSMGMLMRGELLSEYFKVFISNQSNSPILDLVIQFNTNKLGLMLGTCAEMMEPIEEKKSAFLKIPVSVSDDFYSMDTNKIQLAVKNSKGVFLTEIELPETQR